MMNKLFLFRAMIVALMICLLTWDFVLSLTRHTQPLQHRNALLTGALLWILSTLMPQNSDDDWAGQF